MTDLLLRSGLPDLQRQRVEVIESSAETLMALVDDLLDLSKIEVGKLSLNAADFRLRELVGRVVELLRLRADSQGLALELEIEEGLPDALRGDSARLRQVLLNLVGNAIKFTRKGEVAVRVERVPAAGAALRLRFTVRDTGIGVSGCCRPTIRISPTASWASPRSTTTRVAPRRRSPSCAAPWRSWRRFSRPATRVSELRYWVY